MAEGNVARETGNDVPARRHDNGQQYGQRQGDVVGAGDEGKEEQGTHGDEEEQEVDLRQMPLPRRKRLPRPLRARARRGLIGAVGAANVGIPGERGLDDRARAAGARSSAHSFSPNNPDGRSRRTRTSTA